MILQLSVQLSKQLKADTQRPSLIVLHTQIGYGCPAKQGQSICTREPLGEERHHCHEGKNLGWEAWNHSMYLRMFMIAWIR